MKSVSVEEAEAVQLDTFGEFMKLFPVLLHMPQPTDAKGIRAYFQAKRDLEIHMVRIISHYRIFVDQMNRSNDFQVFSEELFMRQLEAYKVEIAKRAAQILSDDLRQHIPVRQIAERFSVSETSLKNYFRGVYGQNISTWLREIRMNEAARLLSDTKRPIAEISEQVGYSNQGKFAAVFKKQFGLSPLEYRRSKNLENR